MKQFSVAFGAGTHLTLKGISEDEAKEIRQVLIDAVHNGDSIVTVTATNGVEMSICLHHIKYMEIRECEESTVPQS